MGSAIFAVTNPSKSSNELSDISRFFIPFGVADVLLRRESSKNKYTK